jgi:hypothetical protein
LFYPGSPVSASNVVMGERACRQPETAAKNRVLAVRLEHAGFADEMLSMEPCDFQNGSKLQRV